MVAPQWQRYAEEESDGRRRQQRVLGRKIFFVSQKNSGKNPSQSSVTAADEPRRRICDKFVQGCRIMRSRERYVPVASRILTGFAKLSRRSGMNDYLFGETCRTSLPPSGGKCSWARSRYGELVIDEVTIQRRMRTNFVHQVVKFSSLRRVV